MKKKFLSLFAVSLAADASLHAANVNWDGGTGTWDTATANWEASTVTWDNTTNAADIGVFGGTVGTVTLNNSGTAINAGGLTFSSTGYTLASATAADALNFGSTQGVVSALVASTTISAHLTGTAGVTIATNGNLSASGGGNGDMLALTGTNTGLSGGIVITSGLVRFGSQNSAGSNAITLNGGGIVASSADYTLTNAVSIGASGGTMRTYGSRTLTLSGAISGSGTLNKTDGGQVTVDKDSFNGFSGTLNIQRGTLRLGNTINGFTANYGGTALNVDSGATLSLEGSSNGNVTHTYNFAGLGSAIAVDGGTLAFKSTNTTKKDFNGALDFSGNNTISYTSSNFTHNLNLNKAITGSGTLNFTWSGVATSRNITFASGQTNNYTGGIVLGNASGTVTMNVNSTLGAADWTVNDADWTVNVSNTTHTLKSLSGAVNSQFNASGSSARLDIGSGNTDTSYSGRINGTLGVSKSGTGTLTLLGTNAYSGTTNVDDGKLLVNGTQTGTGLVTVGASGTLGGTGSLAANVTVNGILAPGASIESLATGAVTFNNNSTFAGELTTNTVDGDILLANGDLALNGTVYLTLTDLLTATPVTNGTILTLINYSGVWNNGLFTYGVNTLADDSSFTLNGQDWKIDYNSTTDGVNFASETNYTNFVNITAIPEPSAALLAGLGALALLRRRRD